MRRRLLVFDCHEAWVYQLRSLDYDLDVIVGLRGRHTSGWDEAMRPVPPNARLVNLREALHSRQQNHCIIAHNLTDLLDVRTLEGPRLLVLHHTLEGLVVEQSSAITPQEIRRAVVEYLRLVGAEAVAISPLKARSWGLTENVVPATADPRDYLPYRGDTPAGLRISNHVHRRAKTLLGDFHEAAFQEIPVTLVGHNPDIPGVTASCDWGHLKEILSRHRFFAHTADRRLGGGYNMATLEAMAAGLPVLGNHHPTSPVVHGVNGFLSDDPQELRCYARLLLGNQDLAARMGREAQKSVAEHFSSEKFKADFSRCLEKACQRWRERRLRAQPASPFVPAWLEFWLFTIRNT